MSSCTCWRAKASPWSRAPPMGFHPTSACRSRRRSRSWKRVASGSHGPSPPSIESPVMRKLVVMGVAGSGKTVLAQWLARHLGCDMLEGDEFHLPSSQEKMRNGIALDDADREPWLARLGEMLASRDG